VDRDYADSDAKQLEQQLLVLHVPGGDGTTDQAPEKTTPHHQGRNIIPIKLASGATSVTVEFTPDAAGSKGTKQKMQHSLYIVTAMTNQFMVLFSR
jgi:hypothetical protein